MENFEEYQDNLMAPTGETRVAFTIDSLDKANWGISKIARAEANIQKRRLAAEEYKRRLDAWLAEANKVDLQTVENITGMLRPWADVEIAKGKQKHVKLLGGQVGFRQSPARLEVTDEKAALAALPDDCKRVTVAVDKTAVKKRIEATGEVPAGVELVPGETRWYVECDPTPELLV